jgi:hypothetical protein
MKYLYNDGHNPFPYLPKGRGGLGYHLPQYKIKGGALWEDSNGYLLDDDNTEDTNAYDINGESFFDDAYNFTEPVEGKMHIHELFGAPIWGMQQAQEFPRAYKAATGDIEEEDPEQEYRPETISLTEKDHSKLDGLKFELRLLTVDNDILKHDLGDESEILLPEHNTKIPEDKRKFCVFDANDDNNAIEIKYKWTESEPTDNTNVELQTVKILGNPDFKPLYIKTPSGYKLYNVYLTDSFRQIKPDKPIYSQNLRDAVVYFERHDGLWRYDINKDIGKGLEPRLARYKKFNETIQMKSSDGKPLYTIVDSSYAKGVDWINKSIYKIPLSKLTFVRKY